MNAGIAGRRPAPHGNHEHTRWHTAGAACALAVFVLLLYYRLLFTNRVLASGDILFYFYPYRDYAAASLRTGHIPLWDPYIFLGVPFLANPQAAVLYPLHWPLLWLPVTKQIYWSAALHTWLLGLGGYLLLRRWAYSPWAGLITGLVLAGSGFYGGLIGHINQMNGATWLPWGVLVVEMAGEGQIGDWMISNWLMWRRVSPIPNQPTPNQAINRSYSPPPKFAIALMGILVALMLLAGHTQTAYINLFGLGVWSVWPLLAPLTAHYMAGALDSRRAPAVGVRLGCGAWGTAQQRAALADPGTQPARLAQRRAFVCRSLEF